jgi:hypothetical protein
MKLWESVIEHRLSSIIKILDNQFSFMPRRSTMEAIYLLRQIIEYHRKRKKDLHIVFIGLEEAYNNVPGEVLC